MPYSQYPSTAAGIVKPLQPERNQSADLFLKGHYSKLYMYESTHMQGKGKKQKKKKENIIYSFITKNPQVENQFKAIHMLVIFKISLKKNYTLLLEFYIHHLPSGRTLNGRSAGRGHVQKTLQWLFAIETCLKTQSFTSVIKITFLDLIFETVKI